MLWGNYFINTLTAWQWLLLGLIPPAILLLYFLKLRRQPLEVPSTYLWSRAIEDLHVNSLWQRLRQNLLLFLQLLLVALIIIACLRPGWRGAELTGDRFIFLVDASASMSATDVAPNRLEAAKAQILQYIDRMKSGDVAMVISFSDIARVEQSFTSSRSLLRRKVNRIRPTNRTSDLGEALRAAAGLANPSQTNEGAGAMPAELFLFTDGGFRRMPDFSLGNLNPEYIRMGSETPENVAVSAFSAEANPDKPEKMQVFAQVYNHGLKEQVVAATLYLNDQLLDSSEITTPPGEEKGVEFELNQIESGVLKLVLEHEDHLSLDNQAYTSINPPHKARVLVITAHNPLLNLSASTEEAVKIAIVDKETPEYLQEKEYQDLAAAGYYDLIIYDLCAPEKMPQANTLFFGEAPPDKRWKPLPEEELPALIDTNRIHPLMQYVEMGNVIIVNSTPWEVPAGGTTLLESAAGPIIAIAPREGYEDVVVGFSVFRRDKKGKLEPNSDWSKRRSFPVFVINSLRYLGGVSSSSSTPTVLPGQPIAIRSQASVNQIEVETPNKKKRPVHREGENAFLFGDTDLLGLYRVYEDDQAEVAQQFAVNLFDSRESNLLTEEKIVLDHYEIEGQASSTMARIEIWRWILLAGLGVLLFEWYVYNRRVYL